MWGKKLGNGLYIKKLNKEQISDFIKVFKESKPSNLLNHRFFALIADDKYIGGIVLNLKPPVSDYGVVKVNIPYFNVIPTYQDKDLINPLIEIVTRKYPSASLTTLPRTYSILCECLIENGFKVLGNKGSVKYWFWEAKTLDKSSSFDWFCKPYGCKMLATTCLKRQRLARIPTGFQSDPIFSESCGNCKFGYKEAR